MLKIQKICWFVHLPTSVTGAFIEDIDLNSQMTAALKGLRNDFVDFCFHIY